MIEEQTIKGRLLQFISYLGIGQGRFEKQCGLANAYVANIRKSVTPEKLQIIMRRYPELNPGWLMTGEGEMLRGGGASGNQRQAGGAPAKDGGKSYRLVPMYNLDARGGFELNEEIGVSEYVVDMVPFPGAQEGDICVPVTGNSMSPTIEPGSVVLLRRVDRWNEFLEMGQIYLVVLDDGRRILKELQSSEEDLRNNLLCVSRNAQYKPVELPKEMIRSVFQVKAVYCALSM